jgi:hypothetical protein
MQSPMLLSVKKWTNVNEWKCSQSEHKESNVNFTSWLEAIVNLAQRDKNSQSRWNHEDSYSPVFYTAVE